MASRRKPATNRARAAPRTVVPKTCKIGASVGGELREFPFTDGETISDVFNKADITLQEGTEILNLETAESVDRNSKPKAGQVYYASQRLVSQAA